MGSYNCYTQWFSDLVGFIYGGFIVGILQWVYGEL